MNILKIDNRELIQSMDLALKALSIIDYIDVRKETIITGIKGHLSIDDHDPLRKRKTGSKSLAVSGYTHIEIINWKFRDTYKSFKEQALKKPGVLSEDELFELWNASWTGYSLTGNDIKAYIIVPTFDLFKGQELGWNMFNMCAEEFIG